MASVLQDARPERLVQTLQLSESLLRCASRRASSARASSQRAALRKVGFAGKTPPASPVSQP